MRGNTFAKFVEWIDGELEVPEEARDDIPSEAFIWYRCLKQTSLVSVEKYSDSSIDDLVSHFDEWYQLYKMNKATEDQKARKRELEDYAVSIFEADQETMPYRTLWETQSAMDDLEREMKERISYTNKQGKQVIKPECFLSWEIAAYITLHSWNKQMGQGAIVASEGDLSKLQTIMELIELEDGEQLEGETWQKFKYRGLSSSLWCCLIDKMDGNYSALFRKTHHDIFELAILLDEEERDILPQDSIYRINDEWGDPYRNPHTMVEAYGVIRDFIAPLTREEIIEWAMDKGQNLVELNTRHYNLF